MLRLKYTTFVFMYRDFSFIPEFWSKKEPDIHLLESTYPIVIEVWWRHIFNLAMKE